MQPLRVLEVGTWEGNSACWLASHVACQEEDELVCVDSFAGSAEHLKCIHYYLFPKTPSFSKNVVVQHNVEERPSGQNLEVTASPSRVRQPRTTQTTNRTILCTHMCAQNASDYAKKCFRVCKKCFRVCKKMFQNVQNMFQDVQNMLQSVQKMLPNVQDMLQNVQNMLQNVPKILQNVQAHASECAKNASECAKHAS